jgi:hypothetical protein
MLAWSLSRLFYTFKVCPREEAKFNITMTWCKLSRVVVDKDADGEEKKASQLEYVQSNPLDLLD